MLRMSIAGATAGMNFVILKINETDVTNLTPEKTVEIFLRAKDPIIVKIRRRRPDDGPNQLNLFDDDSWTYESTSKRYLVDRGSNEEREEMMGVDSGILVSHVPCQTDVSSTTVYYAQDVDGCVDVEDDIVDSSRLLTAVPITVTTAAVTTPTTAKSTSTTTPNTTTDCCHRLIDTQSIFAHCFAPEIDIEEVTLQKSRSDEKLGLTVSYSSITGSTSISASDEDDDDDDADDDDDVDPDSENLTEHDPEDDNDDIGHDHDYDNTHGDIYICDILPDSIAARDGRLRQGDQIIQINGKDISSKDETESLFAENKNSITLLVSRCVYTDDEFLDSAIYCDDKDQNTGMSLSIDCEPSTYSSKSSLRSLSDIQKQQLPLQSITALDTNVVCDHANIRAQLESVNKEISLLNSQISNMKFQKDATATPTTVTTQALPQLSQSAAFLLSSLDQQQQQQQQSSLITNCPVKVPTKPNMSLSSASSPINQKMHKVQNEFGKKSSEATPIHLTPPVLASVVAQQQHTLKNHHLPHQPSKIASSQQLQQRQRHQHQIETEHIYETIPEDSETDSYYCSPYDEQRDQSRIEQWLKSQHVGVDGSAIAIELSSSPHRTLSPLSAAAAAVVGSQQLIGIAANCTTATTASTTTILPAGAASRRDFFHNQTTFSRIYRNNSSGDDYENSSSAYNTGDSCTSNPLTFELKGDEKNQSSSTLVFRPYSRQLDSYDNCKQCQQLYYRKEKVSGVKTGGNRKSSSSSSSRLEVVKGGVYLGDLTGDQSMMFHRSQQQQSTLKQSQQLHQVQARTTAATPPSTTVKNDISRTIKLQNKLFRKAVTHNQQKISEISGSSNNSGSQMISSPSQYQIVRNTATTIAATSAQQLTGSGKSTANETIPADDNNTMVWKVKRRTDGSRYIVRRPAVRQTSISSLTTSGADYSTTGNYTNNSNKSIVTPTTSTTSATLNIDQDQIICNTSGGGVVVHDEIITITESSLLSSSSTSKQQPTGGNYRHSNSKVSTRHATGDTTTKFTREHRRQLSSSSSSHHHHHAQKQQQQHHHSAQLPLPHHQPRDSMSTASVTCSRNGGTGGRHVQKQWVI